MRLQKFFLLLKFPWYTTNPLGTQLSSDSHARLYWFCLMRTLLEPEKVLTIQHWDENLAERDRFWLIAKSTPICRQTETYERPSAPLMEAPQLATTGGRNNPQHAHLKTGREVREWHEFNGPVPPNYKLPQYFGAIVDQDNPDVRWDMSARNNRQQTTQRVSLACLASTALRQWSVSCVNINKSKRMKDCNFTHKTCQGCLNRANLVTKTVNFWVDEIHGIACRDDSLSYDLNTLLIANFYINILKMACANVQSWITWSVGAWDTMAETEFWSAPWATPTFWRRGTSHPRSHGSYESNSQSCPGFHGEACHNRFLIYYDTACHLQNRCAVDCSKKKPPVTCIAVPQPRQQAKKRTRGKGRWQRKVLSWKWLAWAGWVRGFKEARTPIRSWIVPISGAFLWRACNVLTLRPFWWLLSAHRQTHLLRPPTAGQQSWSDHVSLIWASCMQSKFGILSSQAFDSFAACMCVCICELFVTLQGNQQLPGQASPPVTARNNHQGSSVTTVLVSCSGRTRLRLSSAWL